jgi:ATP-dependent Zn protease
MSKLLDHKRMTAIHEAGHAVAHIRLRIDQYLATIVPNPDKATDGAVTADGSHWNKDDGADQVISLCAGFAACVCAGYGKRQANLGCHSDFHKAKGILKFWALGILKDWKAKAIEFMGSPENLRAVELIAEHLLQWERLDSEYMECLVDLADGKGTEADFQEFIAFRKYYGQWPPCQ